jgi:DNA repair exonuclease SbcCD nuclease subunit
MKFIFTADLHIKLNAKNIPKDWQMFRFNMFFDKLNAFADKHKVDFIVIGGDIFDKMPTLEEISFYFDLIRKLKHKTYIYDGNHEATRKGRTFLSLLKQSTLNINPLIERVDHVYEAATWDFEIIPYCELKSIAKMGYAPRKSILFTHVRGNIEPYVKSEVDLDIFNGWDTVYAGDLHNHEDSQRNIVYPGAPMSVSFHRNKVKGGVLLVTDDTWEWKEFKLPQLLRKTVESVEEMVPDKYDHVIYELVGNSMDLADVDVNSDLLDKKVITRDNTSTLSLKNKTIKEELVEYLIEIVSLEEGQLDDILRIFDDYIPDTEIF